MRGLALAAVLAFALSPSAHAAQGARCRDAKGHFIKCPATAPAPAPAPKSGGPKSGGLLAMPALTTGGAGGHPVCKKGKPCGNSCIALNKTCHK